MCVRGADCVAKWLDRVSGGGKARFPLLFVRQQYAALQLACYYKTNLVSGMLRPTKLVAFCHLTQARPALKSLRATYIAYWPWFQYTEPQQN